MILAGVGDAMGYNNGRWEFNHSGPDIHRAMQALGGVKAFDIGPRRVSDDQVMHLATAEALAEAESVAALPPLLARHYVHSFGDMAGRAPGGQTHQSIALLERGAAWDSIPYSPGGGGCGAAMRSMCLGLALHGATRRADLLAMAVESGRITHNHPTGFLGAVAGALFTAFAIEGVPVREWGFRLLDLLPDVYAFLRRREKLFKQYKKDLTYFETRWREYLAARKITGPNDTGPVFPAAYGAAERDRYYQSLSFSGWGGSSGHDAPMIAYDALLGSNGNWVELVYRGILHGGDNDSTGVMAGAW